MTKIIHKKSRLPAWRCLYHTPCGDRWLTVHARDKASAIVLAKNKLITFLYKAGWSLEKVEPVNKEEAA